MKRFFIIFLVWIYLPALVMAGDYQLKPDLKVLLPEVTAPWKVSTEPSSELVEHMIEHVLEEATGKGQNPTKEQARKAALQRVSNDGLYVVNRESGAHLLISFSPLDVGEKAPSSKTIARSVQYAIDGVEGEGWVVTSVRKADIAITGAQEAKWFVIDYSQNGETSLFLGIVGFANPYWFWMYGNDHLKDPKDLDFIEQLMKNIQIQTKPG